MQHILYQVDAFTDVPFKGNPAAVCLLADKVPPVWMQALAAEMNLSETAFLLSEGDAWRLRWFTPKKEVDLCGHATLASAKILFDSQKNSREKPIKFLTQSGELLARWVDDAIELNFPAMVSKNIHSDVDVVRALGFKPLAGVCSGNYALFEAPDPEFLRAYQANIAGLKTLPMNQVIITAKSNDPEFDFISRFFAPHLGIDEDPVTGSAHCLLAPYWSKKLGKTSFSAYQASQRGGCLKIRLSGKRVLITGQATVIFRAVLFV